ncbi:signal peptidase I [Vagococcus fluvialis]|uniref:signal peptidase I n=1 Tax=Vagococcus fluvialis TaxID=2738 RepID=UPI0022E50473|nr:signal peptidase I [Vagococcus fluvialis]
MEKKIVDVIWHWIKMLVICIPFVIIMKAFIFIPLEVTGKSMSPTLKENDFIVMENFSEIDRFDIIVFTAPDGDTYIKRVIGLPGDRVTYEKDQLFINGKKVDEPFLKDVKKKKNEYVFTTDLDTTELIGTDKIPKNQYFVLGDNRRLSKDSRSFGTISNTSIVGKARIVYYPIFHSKIVK